MSEYMYQHDFLPQDMGFGCVCLTEEGMMAGAEFGGEGGEAARLEERRRRQLLGGLTGVRPSGYEPFDAGGGGGFMFWG